MSWALTGVTLRPGGDPLDLELPAGSVTAVVGGDGAGKTSLARLVVGLDLPAAGTVRVPGRDALGFMPSSSGVWGDLSVAENVDLVARTHGLRADDDRVRRLLAGADLDRFTARLGRQLSGGMRQKLGFCLALLHAPELVVLDEPSTGVDPVSRTELWRMMTEAAADGTTVLFTTTYLDEAERAGQVLVLDRGSALYTGDPGRAWTALHGSIRTVEGEATGPSWRRGRVRRELVGGPGTGEAPDLEDTVIGLTLEHRGPEATGPSAEPAPSGPGTMSQGSAVEVRHLVTAFGDQRAVDDVSLTLRPGQVLGLLGANGAGKTTLIRTVLGLLAPDGGEIRVLGGPVTRQVRRRIGYVPQGLGLATDLTVAENLGFVAEVFGAEPVVPAELADVRDRLVGRLGLGVQRRTAFAAALGHGPELLVLDEPTSGVDPLARAALWDSVRAAAEAGAAVLVTTHYMQEAEQCDEVVLMARGRVVRQGTPASLTAGVPAVQVVTADWSGTVRTLSAAGLPVAVDGRALRVAGVPLDRVRAVLPDAELREVPARLDEVMVLAG
ncbi:ATP-binding cassette domain-containing protein [Cellulomonas denverensis]|uniref:ABC transporter ATP-binding protein n=1 Tax=Cellulomonas denverensis TaxID=264297 RepID=A0A7X6KVJ5_9CELL|nr:ATP-binding cassette domain-containing protein [Cellulomonas denverensis]NKY23076.1 ABC transporter ATP-binding protein [Cellulomonas denverensis]GIG23843.1 ABC transporter ATP-binding protein [Cellulomonas denverensis]